MRLTIALLITFLTMIISINARPEIDDHPTFQSKQHLVRFAIRSLIDRSADEWDESTEPYGRFYDFGVRKRLSDPTMKRKRFIFP